jgi:hypothetical protein
MQSCLEVKGLQARNELLLRNDYSRNDEYSDLHPDALSDGDPQGKGTGIGGHLHSTPDCTRPSVINYSNFDTDGGGGQYDIEGRNGVGGRNFLMTISVYNRENNYCGINIDTTANVADGQIQIDYLR